MKILKKTCVFCLLIALTVATVLLPRAVTERKQKSLLSKNTYWNYGGRGDIEYTSEKLAELFNNSYTNTVIYYSDNYDSQSSQGQKLYESTETLFDEAFKYDSYVCGYMKNLLSNSESYYMQKKVLTELNGRSVILDITEVDAKGTNLEFSFSFEENTNTLISFSFYYEKNAYKDETLAPIKALEQAVEDYYAKQLNLSDAMYYHQSESGEEFGVFDLGIANKQTDYYAEEEK